MSITTHTGDQGETRLLFNRCIAKDDPRIEALGTLDELSAALGLALALGVSPTLQNQLLQIQSSLVHLMGALAVHPQDRKTAPHLAFPEQLSNEISTLERWIHRLEEQSPSSLQGWKRPHRRPGAAVLDLARAICRRGERRLIALRRQDPELPPSFQVYLNRLSDFLWLAGVQEDRSSE